MQPASQPSPDIERRYAIYKVQEAIEAILAYKRALALQREFDAQASQERRNLFNKASELLTETRIIGGPGRPCGVCDGTGREPGS
ncbi:hypothetical protein SAMN02745166_03085 [Prosthecobacter debontii]|uniref:Uncharacterized protein n=1 Tax=Prosthecobacter debontii TaxID=48467 RepID=A0A1T4YG26_9BACT|nr:hypothetical protein SAMN02745166_03085 [Prosthecobacter debontii]